MARVKNSSQSKKKKVKLTGAITAPSRFYMRTVDDIRRMNESGSFIPVGRKNGKEEIIELPTDTIVRNLGIYQQKVLVGTATLGVVRIEWTSHRKGQVIPINWRGGEVLVPYVPNTFASVGFGIGDAQNEIVQNLYDNKYEWLLLWEDDVCPPFDAMLRLDDYMKSGDIPIIAGLYYTKSDPSWPLIFRGRGNGCYLNFKMGDKVWTDGVCTGFTLIHGSILRWMHENSPHYDLPSGKKVARVFDQPQRIWTDPETNNYFTEMGTSDLYFCNRVMRENVFAKTGWNDYSKKKEPFLVDTSILCHQIDLQGRIFPQSAKRIVGPKIYTTEQHPAGK